MTMNKCDVLNKPRLFGIKNSNRDFENPDTWGKNQFNSSFPAALSCYLFSKQIKAVYLKVNETLKPVFDYISIDDLFHINPLGEDTYYSFETPFISYQKYIYGTIPRNDLVVLDSTSNCQKSSLEIKLTALPDNTTCSLSEENYGCEIVIRPDTIVYLACSIIQKYEHTKQELDDIMFENDSEIKDWTEAKYVLPHIHRIQDTIYELVKNCYNRQNPIIMEPVWKTEGKSPKLANNCLDVFVWSDLGMLNLFLPDKDAELNSISRHTRSMVWLYKMLYDYCKNNRFNPAQIIDELSYNTKNDKAFSTVGARSHPLMSCKELVKPRITKDEIKNIILGGGQNLLSPERRFDAIIYNSPDLFE